MTNWNALTIEENDSIITITVDAAQYARDNEYPDIWYTNFDSIIEFDEGGLNVDKLFALTEDDAEQYLSGVIERATATMTVHDFGQEFKQEIAEEVGNVENDYTIEIHSVEDVIDIDEFMEWWKEERIDYI